jgi:leader peptidase (prepilin peptidase)/N-methyltransferase
MPWELLFSPWSLGVIGLAVGSFLNVVIHRLPQMLERGWWGDVAAQLGDVESHRRVFAAEPPAEVAVSAARLDDALQKLPALGLAQPPSRCPACAHRIRWYENVPLISWLALRGRCSACKTTITARYPLVEGACGALFAAAASVHGAQWTALLWCAVLAMLLALSVIDWDTTVLPDVLTLPLLWAGLACAAAGWLPGVDARQSVFGAALGYGSLWSVYWLFKLATGKEGMGFGDFKLLGALGAWLGWQAILPIVLMASAIGAVAGIGMKMTGALREGRFVPFGPFLAGGGVVVMLAGLPRVLGWMGWA